jgi:hypothetical protein
MSTTLLCPLAEVLETIQKSTHPELRRLQLEEVDDRIIITGRVTSFYFKQLAQESIRAIAAGRQIINQVEVCR